MMRSVATAAVAIALLGACGDAASPADAFDGPPLTLNIAALTLTGVADAVWDIAIDNEAAAPVLRRRITSSKFGDSRGSASFIGVCDAQTELGTADGVHDNTVTVRIVGLYGGVVLAPGVYGDAAPSGTLLFENPGDLVRVVDCVENGDMTVQFDVALMRPANQGFFDIAVNFNDVFCSAKFDCDGSNLVFDSEGLRSETYVLGLACSAGLGASTVLYMDDITIDCHSGADTWTSVVDPTDGDGGLCEPGSADGLAVEPDCSAVDSHFSTAGPLFQAAVYKGQEDGDTTQDVRYWNIAFGITAELEAGACSLHTRATADHGEAPVIPGGVVAAGQVYPYIDFGITDLFQCGQNPLSFGGTSGVQVVYRSSGDASTSFQHSYP